MLLLQAGHEFRIHLKLSTNVRRLREARGRCSSLLQGLVDLLLRVLPLGALQLQFREPVTPRRLFELRARKGVASVAVFLVLTSLSAGDERAERISAHDGHQMRLGSEYIGISCSSSPWRPLHK